MLYLLDTNIASYIIRGNVPGVRERLAALPAEDQVAVSAVTRAELLYGVAKRGNPRALASVVNEFLHRVEVLPWDAAVATTYAELRAACDAAGVALGALDVMIAAHAKAVDAVLVTRDQAFRRIPDGLAIEDWTT